MKPVPLFALTVALALSPLAAGAQSPPGRDQNFVTSVAQSDNAEVALSRLALQKAVSEPARAFASRMVADHMHNMQQLQQQFASQGYGFVSELNDVDAGTFRRLNWVRGIEFDRLYLSQMVADHIATEKLLSDTAKYGVDPTLKAFAAQSLPVVQEHVRLAKAALSQIGGPTTINPAM